MIEHQETWTGLAFPNQRAELLVYLADCCEPSHYLTMDEVEFDLHFFFDDHDFADDPMSLIGIVLFDESEVAVMTDLVKAYAAAVGAGPKMPDIRTVDWQPVVAAARKAHAVIRKGQPFPEHVQDSMSPDGQAK